MSTAPIPIRLCSPRAYARPRKCDVCGERVLPGTPMAVMESSLDPERKLRACLGCYVHRGEDFMLDKWTEAVARRFPRATESIRKAAREARHG